MSFSGVLMGNEPGDDETAINGVISQTPHEMASVSKVSESGLRLRCVMQRNRGVS
jgi:hypothetical protein